LEFSQIYWEADFIEIEILLFIVSAKDCIVLATENKQSDLYIVENKIQKLTEHIGCVYSGMGPDYRLVYLIRIFL